MNDTTRRLMMGAAGAGEKVYVEDVFQTWLYTGNGSTQTITNGIDLSGKGGFVWIKKRSAAGDHVLVDTARGIGVTSSDSTQILNSNLTGNQTGSGNLLYGLTSTSFTLGAGGGYGTNDNADTYASWTFRKAEKFFDVVTYTGNGSIRTIAHNLGSVPGTIFVKCTSASRDWPVYHRSIGATKGLFLNLANAESVNNSLWNDTAPTASVFSLGEDFSVNQSGATYVAYLFAHDAGGFGDSGNDNVISCGSYTGNGSATAGPTVTLGWEPQWVLIKGVSAESANTWYMFDSMRGIVTGGNDATLYPALTSGEITNANSVDLSAAGFQVNTNNSGMNNFGSTYIYIAIRRGPMKTPTDATKVFAQVARTGTGAAANITGTGFAPDAMIYKSRSNAVAPSWQTRLQGGSPRLSSASNAAESADNELDFGLTMDGIRVLTGDGVINFSSWTYINYFLRRAPGFFDVVAYTGNGVAGRAINHNLGVKPQLMIVKSRSGAYSWQIYTEAKGATEVMTFTSDQSDASSFPWNDTEPTASVFTVGGTNGTNSTLSNVTYIAYLFASCPGVSKVGSYTGTGTTLSVDCGFTNGARFVLIKRTDSTGDWYVWDTARGIVSGDDPYLLLNSTAAEVTNTDYIDPLSSGFQISSTAPDAINANGGNFIFLAVA